MESIADASKLAAGPKSDGNVSAYTPLNRKC